MFENPTEGHELYSMVQYMWAAYVEKRIKGIVKWLWLVEIFRNI